MKTFTAIKMNNYKIIFFVFALVVFQMISFEAFPQGGSGPLKNGIFLENIHTVQFFRKGWEFSLPVIELGSDQQLLLKFDELTDETTNFSYTITHCGADWYPSRLVEAEYLEGFIENPVNDYAASANTTVRYTNYQLLLPNEQARFLISGNYLLTVFEEGKRDIPVLTRRFYVVEPITEIRGEVKKSTFEGFRGRDQEIDFTVDHSHISILDPRTEVKVVLMQNAREDNCLTNLKPLFVKDNQLIYDLSRENVFPGGNEFRNFDTKDLRINGLGVAKIEFSDPFFQVTLRTDQMRKAGDYLTEEDLNGRYLVKNNRANDSDLESDYILALFSLKMAEPLSGGNIYVFGALSDWQCLPANKMQWNYDLKQYEASLKIKQGFYDYQYVYIQNGDTRIDNTLLEGSHVETENDYQLFVYFHNFSSRYDKLIGYRTINSVKR